VVLVGMVGVTGGVVVGRLWCWEWWFIICFLIPKPKLKVIIISIKYNLKPKKRGWLWCH